MDDIEAPTGATGAAPALEADDLSVRRGGRDVLDGVSLAVDRDDSLLIRGASGSGKTTLFTVLGLLAPPDEGEVRVDGRAASDLPERERARIRRETIGFVFQTFRLVEDLTARDNAALPAEHAGSPDQAWLDELFERLELTEVADQYPATLSGGERQRVAVARALVNRPTVVLADEPTGQLDPDTADRVLDLLFDLRAETGTALVTTSHDPRLAGRFRRSLRLVDGRLAEAPPTG
jgi:putative ABC transport system ATP-binding protein